jgi:hypothetical protein
VPAAAVATPTSADSPLADRPGSAMANFSVPAAAASAKSAQVTSGCRPRSAAATGGRTPMTMGESMIRVLAGRSPVKPDLRSFSWKYRSVDSQARSWWYWPGVSAVPASTVPWRSRSSWIPVSARRSPRIGPRSASSELASTRSRSAPDPPVQAVAARNAHKISATSRFTGSRRRS